MSFRVLPVPDGLDGQRVDSALARMLGLSRTKAGELCAQGRVVSEGNVLTKSDRLLGGSMLEVDLPQPRSPEPAARRGAPVRGQRLRGDEGRSLREL